ncbi:acyl-CoA dehydrogenase [Herbidospora galbida]|uniref:Acyl-CoA dehydrogenase n=1 Tax=Herbidospora galbida TaxID=2575442 RepID=A0A4U3MIB9_9ACTN|nr:acyl-CoA dehydrogenase family protein [Herbidospora galbida]TKK88600.1 acyl-CoA dehydrogenase [Herbidospora galbida]
MDFDLDEPQRELRTLAAGLLDKEADPEAHEKTGEPYDARLWATMARAGLTGACLPEESGGAGLGPVEMAVLLREVGAHVAPVPLLPALVTGLVVGRHGTAAQQGRLAPVAEGGVPYTYGVGGRVAVANGRLTGRVTGVPYAAQAAGVLVAVDDDVYVVHPEALTVRRTPTATGEPAGVVTLDDAPGELIPGAAHELGLLVRAGLTATASGVLAQALKITTDHVRTRRQFDRALAEFQAVTMQIADVYIAARALDVAVWSGVFRLAAGLDADRDLAVAALHTADSALRALYTCQHLHGGLGLDVTYPLHRYFAWGKHIAHVLGGAEAQLDLIGDLECSSN